MTMRLITERTMAAVGIEGQNEVDNSTRLEAAIFHVHVLRTYRHARHDPWLSIT
jgi:hypothetical protein